VIKDLRAGDPATVGPYKLLGRLGAGGMGEVYLGKSPGGRLVAIKLIRPELAEERGFRSRFASEISAARNVSGIYTAAVVDADSAAELPWMATVYVPGPSLTDAVEDNGPLPVESVLALAAGLAEALQAIHRAGLVHRDLKPSNVLLASDGPRVIDFGISLALERSMMTATGMVMGSPGFMSPEQARGQREVGAPTDVFSLGTVLAYAATGGSPFGTGPTPALLYRVVNEPPDLTAVPARLSVLIGRCLAKDPAERPTPTEILTTLGDDVDVLTGEWLPPAIAASMSSYTPTAQTPLPPGYREDRAQATPPGTPVAAASATELASGGQAAPAPATPAPATPAPATPAPATPAPATPAPATPAPGLPAEPAAGPAGYEPTTLEPAVPAAPVSATRVEQQLPDTSLVPVSAPLLLGPTAPGSTHVMPPGERPSGLRRWRWLLTVAAAVVIVAVAAVLLTRHSPGTGKGGGAATASLAGETTNPPATPTTSSPSPTPSQTPTATPTATATSASPSYTYQPSTAASTTSSPTPTQTATTSPTPTDTATSSPTPTDTSTTSPTPTDTATTSPTPTDTSTTSPTPTDTGS
jgi:eukaryotic-like serine/threonine-protein kinase